MSQHYTRDTVEVSEWCRKCKKHTMHRVDGTVLGPCLDCLKKPESAKSAAAPGKREPLKDVQLDLFRK